MAGIIVCTSAEQALTLLIFGGAVDQRRLLDALAIPIALAIERASLAEQMGKAGGELEKEELRGVLNRLGGARPAAPKPSGRARLSEFGRVTPPSHISAG